MTSSVPDRTHLFVLDQSLPDGENPVCTCGLPITNSRHFRADEALHGLILRKREELAQMQEDLALLEEVLGRLGRHRPLAR